LEAHIDLDSEQHSSEYELTVAQEAIHSLDPSILMNWPKKMKKREKKNQAGEADNAFVNVFLQLEIKDDEYGKAGNDPAEELKQNFPELFSDYLESQNQLLSNACVRRGAQISLTVPVSRLKDLAESEHVSFVAPSESLKLDLPSSVATSSAPKRRRITSMRTKHQNGKDVIIGIIDVGGFDFAHPDFLDDHGNTRFVRIWDQGGEFRVPPKGFTYGSEFTQQQLNKAIQDEKNGTFRAVDLERQSQRSEASHGTHVASIAAGNSGVCPEAEIAAVLINVPISNDLQEHRRSTFSDSSRIAHAVNYLLAYAKERGKPISINISLGTNGGAHDGSSGISRWLDHALTLSGRSICIAAGNAGQEEAVDDKDIGWIMGRIHTSGRVTARGLVTELEWVVIGNGIADISENELEIWYSPQDRIIVSVQPPGESTWYKVDPLQFMENKRLSDGTTLSIYNELYHPSNGGNYISIYLSPNLNPQNPRGIRAGLWKVRLEGEEIRDGRFHAWIERDDPAEIGRIAGERFFRFPSFFAATSNVDSHSVSSLGCGQNVITVANLDKERSRINITSSQGPTRDEREKPDICAPGTNIRAAKGFSLDDDKWVEMSGTSMASPYATGVIGLMLVVNRDLNAAQCAGILQKTANPLPGMSYNWRNDTGFGEINPELAIKEAMTFAHHKEVR
ncbi:MAG: S8 family peptidase, partial [Candidatus Thiodiazotropha taylori]|nr:S8 family peptidase [Candidatus Thiodiazotropha endolucinida]MCW4227686.1 S8 family peptidase [Candidatus Thiodiazotropha taylori]